MRPKRKVSCVLCELSDENKLTGPLSTKDNVTAHQNCLLYSAGIYCKDTPEFHDLFGFSVEDVLNEVKRGRRLLCKMCWRNGATAGCEVKRCKKTYHYPCAIQAEAGTVEDEDEGKYLLYCFDHYQQHYQSKQDNKSVDGLSSSSPKPTTSRESSKAGSTKRRLSGSDQEEEMLSKRKFGVHTRIIDDFSDSDSDEVETEMNMYAPIESDIDDNQIDAQDAESQSLLQPEFCKEPQSCPSTSDKSLPPSLSHAQLKVISGEADDKDQGCSPEHSPVQSPDQHKPGPSVPQQGSPEPPPSPALSESCSVTGSPLHTSTVISPGPPEAIGAVPLSSSVMPSTLVYPLKSAIDAVSFWKNCNAAGCTEALFADFIQEINEISSRIRSEQGSQKDCDLALKVITESGKLEQLVAKQQQEFQRKQTELTKAAAAMNKVISALKR